MKYHRLHCWDCGVQIVEQQGTRYLSTPQLREVVFECSNGSYMKSPFCVECAEKPWPLSRLVDFKAAADLAAGAHRPFSIVRAEAVVPVNSEIAGVLS